jgi:hypothetical protein
MRRRAQIGAEEKTYTGHSFEAGDFSKAAKPAMRVSKKFVALGPATLMASRAGVALIVGALVSAVFLIEVNSLRAQLVDARSELAGELSESKIVQKLSREVETLRLQRSALEAKLEANLAAGTREPPDCKSHAPEAHFDHDKDAVDGDETTPITIASMIFGFLIPMIGVGVLLRRFLSVYADAARDAAAHPGRRVSESLAYRADLFLSSDPHAKTKGLAVLTFLMIVVGSQLFRLATGRGNADCVWASWAFVSDPAAHIDEEGAAARAVSLALTVGGMFVFALLVGIVGDLVAEKMESLNRGGTRVLEDAHTLVLGYARSTFVCSVSLPLCLPLCLFVFCFLFSLLCLPVPDLPRICTPRAGRFVSRSLPHSKLRDDEQLD